MASFFRSGPVELPLLPQRRPMPRPLRFVLRHRRWLALVCFVLAGVNIAMALTPATVRSGEVLVPIRDLAAGTALRADMFTTTPWPGPGSGSSVLTDSAAVTGKSLAIPLRAGQPLYSTMLVGQGLLSGSPPGTTAVPVRFADPASVRLLTAGQRITVVLTRAEADAGGSSGGAGGGGTILARDVTVLWLPTGKQDSGGLLPASDQSQGLAVVAASGEQATALAGANSRGKVYFLLVAP